MTDKILALVDGSIYSESVCHHAAWAASRLNSGVDLLHVLGRREAPTGDLSGALRLGARTAILNELVAYLDLAHLPDDALSPHSRLIMTYALCGFANIGSLGIMIGGLSAMVPSRRADILALSPRTLLSGTLATLSCGAIVGCARRVYKAPSTNLGG